MIISVHNPKIKWVHSLQSSSRARQEAGAFVVEGVRLAEEALASSWPAELVLYTKDLEKRGQTVLQGFTAQGSPVEEVTEPVFRAASDTETPQGILAVILMQALPLPAAPSFIFIPDSLRDPGNLGTILRTAAAAGVEVVFLPPGTADAFAPKVLRAGMGAHFRLPLVQLTWEEISYRLKKMPVYLATVGAGLPYYQADYRSPLALVVGGEAEGAGMQARNLATSQVHIPMPGGSESLNVAVAAGVLLFEVVHQRLNKEQGV